MLPDAQLDDIPDVLRVNLFGEQFCAVENVEIEANAAGVGCLATMAQRLLAVGLDPDRELALYRASKLVGRTTLGDAAQTQQET
jgi:hypothetical protein